VAGILLSWIGIKKHFSMAAGKKENDVLKEQKLHLIKKPGTINSSIMNSRLRV